MPKLIIKQAGQSRDFPIAKESLSIGRTPENDIELKDSLISRRHTSIVKKGDRFVVYDLGSSNGTFVNRERIESKPLENGDVIRVGDTEIFYLEDDRAKAPMPPAVIVTPAPARLEDKKFTDFAGSQQIVQRVDALAESFSLDISDALSKGLSLKDIRRESVGGEKAAKESKMFFILFQVGKALSTAATLDDMLLTAAKLIFEVISAERCVLLLKDPDGTLAPRLTVHRTRGVIDGKDLPVPKTITSQVIGEKVSIVTSDALQDPRFMQGLSIVQYNIRSALCVPLWEADRVYGAIYLDNLAKSYAFTKDDLELLTAIANLVAIRIRGEETQARLRAEETLRANLSKYHSPDHVKLLMERGGEVGLEVAEREVSVVFIDVEGSTRMAETGNASEVAKLLNEFFLMATNAIFLHNGHVNNFIGDEVMAIFNAPLDMTDHAISAVKSCVTFLKDLERFCRENPERKFNVRCAINSGTAVAGNVGTPTHIKYTVLGDTVNVAARLTKLPQVNSIVVGEKTYDLVRHVFKAKDLGDTLLKGKEKTLRAYEIQI
ncbi:MAG TPA: adenylate/guanylate cyclase domain-containing protein [Planctomycetota bacterium]|nr:adenylate/guanylate cyclase domain-containing protein [Planctomycetota bacterium]